LACIQSPGKQCAAGGAVRLERAAWPDGLLQ
jgi:hypothetical protein